MFESKFKQLFEFYTKVVCLQKKVSESIRLRVGSVKNWQENVLAITQVNDGHAV